MIGRPLGSSETLALATEQIIKLWNCFLLEHPTQLHQHFIFLDFWSLSRLPFLLSCDSDLTLLASLSFVRLFLVQQVCQQPAVFSPGAKSTMSGRARVAFFLCFLYSSWVSIVIRQFYVRPQSIKDARSLATKLGQGFARCSKEVCCSFLYFLSIVSES